MKKFIRNASIFLAVLLTTVGLVTLTTQERALSPDLYTTALEEAGVYEQVTTITEEKLTYFLKEVAAGIKEEIGLVENEEAENPVFDKVFVWAVDTIIDTQTGTIVESISEEIQLEGRIENFGNNVITYSLAWLSGDTEAPTVFNYIPTADQLEELEEMGVVERVAVSIVGEVLGLADLPTCQNSDAEKTALEALQAGEFTEVTCTSDTIRPLIDKEVALLIPGDIIAGFQDDLDGFIKEYNLDPVLGNIYDSVKGLAEFKQDALKLRSGLEATLQAAMTMILISIFLAALGIYLTQKDRLSTTLRIYLTSGILMLIYVAIYQLVIVNITLDSINFREMSIEDEIISPTQSALFISSIESATTKILKGMTDYTFTVGLVLTIFSGIGLLLVRYQDNIKGFFKKNSD